MAWYLKSTAKTLQLVAVVAPTRASSALFVLTHYYSGYPMVRQARDIVRSGELGKLRVIQAEYTTDWLATLKEETGMKQAQWRADPQRSGSGCVGDIGTHAYHLARFATGLTPQELSGELATLVPGRRVDDHVPAQLRHAGGVAQLPETVPGLEDGLAGIAFFDATARSSAENGAWVRPVQL